MIRGIDYIGVAAGIILTKNKQILLIKRAREPRKDWWAFPTGIVELGETAKKTIIREMKEELNIKIKPKFLFYYDSFDKTRQTHYLELWFTAEINGKISLKNDEILESRLVPPKKVLKIDLPFTQNEVIRKYFKIHN